MTSRSGRSYTARMSPSKLPLLHFVAESDLIQRLDDYRFTHRFPSRAAAIKWLLEWALAQNPAPPQRS